MAVTYESFIAKFEQFSALDEFRFNAFLTDALLEIATIEAWGVNRDRAVEMLTGHFLLLSDTETAIAAQTLEGFKLDDRGYEVSYQKQSAQKSTDYSSTWFGREYERLLKIADARLAEENLPPDRASAISGNIFHAVRGSAKKIDW